MAKKKDTGPLFEGMVLTEWQKLSNSIFGGLFRKSARADKELMKTLSQADIRIMPEVYKATTLMSTIFSTLGCIGVDLGGKIGTREEKNFLNTHGNGRKSMAI